MGNNFAKESEDGGICIRQREAKAVPKLQAKHCGRVKKTFNHTQVDPQQHTIVGGSAHVGQKGWPSGWMTLWPNSELVFDFGKSLFLTRIKFYCANLAASPRDMELHCSNSAEGPWCLIYQFAMCDRYRQPRDIASDNNRNGIRCESFWFLGTHSTANDSGGMEHPLNNRGAVYSSPDCFANEDSLGCGRYWKLKFKQTNGDSYMGINDCQIWGTTDPLPPPRLEPVAVNNDEQTLKISWGPVSGADRYAVVGYMGALSRSGGFLVGMTQECSWVFDTPQLHVPYCFQVLAVSAEGIEGMPSLCSECAAIHGVDLDWILLEAEGDADGLDEETPNPLCKEGTEPSPGEGAIAVGGDPSGTSSSHVLRSLHVAGREEQGGEEITSILQTKSEKKSRENFTVEEYAKDYKATFESILRGRFDEVKNFPVASSVCVFVSSTFDDTTAERNYLNEFVFPQLSKYCKARNLDFEVVDLRWGIRDESTDDHKTIDICLSEVQRCLQRSTAASFFFLSGERYGWRALPNRVEAEEFEIIISCLEEGSAARQCCQQWFLKDCNSLVPEYILQSISAMEKKGGEFASFWGRGGAEAVMQEGIRSVLAKCDLSEEKKRNWLVSVTEREVSRAIFQYEGNIALSNVCFMRTIEGLEEAFIAESSSPANEQYAKTFFTIPETDRILLSELRERVKAALPSEQLREYNVRWEDEGKLSKNIEYLREFAADFMNDMEHRIELGLKCRPTLTLVEKEFLHHHTFACNRALSFTGRSGLIESVYAHFCGRMDSDTARTVQVLYGVSGSGKTSTMCKLACHAGLVRDTPDAVVMIRMCGTSPLSSSARDIMRSLCQQIIRVYSITDESFASVDMADFENLTTMFAQLLEASTAERPLFVFIDSLDQLNDTNNGREQPFKWLPRKLSEHTRVIISTLPESEYGVFGALEQVLPPTCFECVAPITNCDEAFSFVTDVLRISGRQIACPIQEQCILQSLETAFAAGKGFTMLHLKLLCDRVMKWRHYSSSDDPSPALEHSVEDLIQHLYSEWEITHGKKFVELFFRLLLTSRYGLSRENMVDIISADDEVLGRRGEREAVLKYHEPPIRRLPPLVLTRFLVDMGEYMMERGQHGVNLLSLYHRQFIAAARRRYITSSDLSLEMGRRLAEYFSGSLALRVPGRLINRQTWYFEDKDSTLTQVNVQKVVEWPHALAVSSQHSELDHLLCDLEYIEAKFSAGPAIGADLLDEYTTLLAWQQTQSNQQNISVVQFYRFVTKWLNVLSLSPNMTFALAMNTPRQGNRVYQTAVARQADGRESRSFLQWKNPPVAGDACISTRVCDVFLTSCRWSKDGSKFCIGTQSVCSVFNASMNLLSTFTGHEGWVRGCCFSPNGETVCSISQEDCKGYLWNVHTGEQIRTLSGHYNWLMGCDWCHVNNIILTVSSDCTAALWDPSTGNNVGLLLYHTGPVEAGAFTPDGVHACTVSADRSLILWSVDQRQPVTVFSGLDSPLVSVCVSPDGQRVCAGAVDHTIHVWSLASKKLLSKISKHSGEVWDCVFAPNSIDILSVGADNEGYLHSSSTGKLLAALSGHGAWVTAVDWVGDLILTVSEDGCAKVWSRLDLRPDVAVPEAIFTCHHGNRGSALHFSEDGTRLDVLGKDLSARSYSVDLASGELTLSKRQTFSAELSTLTYAACTPSGSSWVVISYDRNYYVLDVESGQVKSGHSEYHTVHNWAQWDPQASSGDGNSGLLLGGHCSDAKGKLVMHFPLGSGTSADFACQRRDWLHDGDWAKNIVVAACSKSLNIYDTTDPANPLHVLCPVGAFRCCISSDGKTCLSVTSNGQLGYAHNGPDAFVYDVSSGQEKCKLDLNCSGVLECALSPDGTTAYLMFSQRGTQYFRPAVIQCETVSGSVIGRFFSPWNDEFKSLSICSGILPPLFAVGDSKGRIFLVQHDENK